MNKTFESLLKRLRDLGLPKGCFAIFGSGPMGIRNIIDCNDLDVIVTKEVYSDMKKTGDWEIKNNEFCEYLEKDGIEIYMSWHPASWDICRLIQGAEVIDGLPFVKLSQVIEWKTTRDSEKDGRHLGLISSFLSRSRKDKCQFCGYETDLIKDVAESIDESKEASCAAEVGGIKTIHVCKFCYALGDNYVGCMHYPNMYGDHDEIMKQISVVGNIISDKVDSIGRILVGDNYEER